MSLKSATYATQRREIYFSQEKIIRKIFTLNFLYGNKKKTYNNFILTSFILLHYIVSSIYYRLISSSIIAYLLSKF